MKNVKPSVRRILGLAIAIVAGSLATFVLASPASAHYSSVSGHPHCDYNTGTYWVDWTVTNSEKDQDATLTGVVATPINDAGDIKDKAPVLASAGKLVGIQKGIPGTSNQATLTETSTWPDKWTDHQIGTVWMSGKCKQHQAIPDASFASNCDGTVTVTLANQKEATAPARFTVTTGSGPKTFTVAVGGTQAVTTTAADSASITVTATGFTSTYSWKQPPNCIPAKVSSKSDCTSLTVTLDNPAGNDPVEATITSGTNPPVKVTVPGGGSKDVTFPATTGTKATVTFGAGAAAAARVAPIAAAAATAPATVSWVSPGATCTPPTTSTTPPSLPVTGAKLGGVIGAGAGLIVVGAGLVLFLRRRRNIAPLQ